MRKRTQQMRGGGGGVGLGEGEVTTNRRCRVDEEEGTTNGV